jgi:hypothetical protein
LEGSQKLLTRRKAALIQIKAALSSRVLFTIKTGSGVIYQISM